MLCYAAAAITKTSADFRDLGNGFRNQTCTKKHPTGFNLADDTHTALHAFLLRIRNDPGFSLALVGGDAGRDGGRAGTRLVRKLPRQSVQSRRATGATASGSASTGRVSQADPGDLSVRLDRMENALRQLTGTIESLQYRNQQLEMQLKRMQDDTEY